MCKLDGNWSVWCKRTSGWSASSTSISSTAPSVIYKMVLTDVHKSGRQCRTWMGGNDVGLQEVFIAALTVDV
jgi:hypothetical protein